MLKEGIEGNRASEKSTKNENCDFGANRDTIYSERTSSRASVWRVWSEGAAEKKSATSRRVEKGLHEWDEALTPTYPGDTFYLYL